MHLMPGNSAWHLGKMCVGIHVWVHRYIHAYTYKYLLFEFSYLALNSNQLFWFLITPCHIYILKVSLKKKVSLFYYFHLILAVLGLRHCTWASSSCGKQGLLSSCGVRASHYWLLLFQRISSRCMRSVVAACGIFPDQGSNPCPLHWQADSGPSGKSLSVSKF